MMVIPCAQIVLNDKFISGNNLEMHVRANNGCTVHKMLGYEQLPTRRLSAKKKKKKAIAAPTISITVGYFQCCLPVILRCTLQNLSMPTLSRLNLVFISFLTSFLLGSSIFDSIYACSDVGSYQSSIYYQP